MGLQYGSKRKVGLISETVQAKEGRVALGGDGQNIMQSETERGHEPIERDDIDHGYLTRVLGMHKVV